MKGVSKLFTGILAIILCGIGLLYLLCLLYDLAHMCEEAQQKPAICFQLSTFSLSFMIVLVIIGAFIVLAEVAVYILLSSQ